jgi:hypothetical protein
MPIWSVWLSTAELPGSADWVGGGDGEADVDNGDDVVWDPISVRLLGPFETVLGLLVVPELVVVGADAPEAVVVPSVLSGIQE